MQLTEEWQLLQSRIIGLRETAKLAIIGAEYTIKAQRSSMLNPLKNSINRIRSEIFNFQKRHRYIMPPTLQKIIDDFESNSSRETSGHQNIDIYILQSATLEICNFEAEFSYHLLNKSAAIQRITNRAFLHLSRSLTVDQDLSLKWEKTFKEGEVKIEKLGNLHLLMHGIWGIKSHAEGERTDLILSEPSINNITEATEGLILTEWKIACSPKDANDQWHKALKQAQRYSHGSLAGFALQNIRYLVLVTMEHADSPPDRIEDGVTYKHINIAIRPSSPSKTR